MARVLFLTSNGAGLGHLTRSVAIGRRLRAGVDLSVFTLSQAAPLIADEGVAVEYLFSRNYARAPHREWNHLYHDRLEAILAEQEPSVVSFDGTYPYGGLVASMPLHPRITWVWTRRAMWKQGTSRRALKRARMFDHVVEPGEYAAGRDAGPTVALRDHAHQVGPIVYTGHFEVLDRDTACAGLGIDPHGCNVLVQLGAGNINEIDSTSGIVVRRLLRGGATVVVPVSPIASSPPDLPAEVHTVSAYPIAPLFSAFDASVAAAGYNSFHELLQLRVPSLFIPNRQTSVDDQQARADWACEAGVALAADERDGSLVGQVDALLDDRVRTGLLEGMDRLDPANGAEAAGALFSDWATGNGSGDGG